MIRFLLKVFAFIIICVSFFASVSFSQMLDTTVVIDEIVVTAGKVPFSLSEVPRSITVITQEELKNAPVQNIQDLLSNYSGIDIKKRGPEGVQADVSIRGGSFEQTLILIDGIKMSDPQTAHHNLNLPINIEDVERIEILKGQASSIYGPNALSGVINIISKKGISNKMTANLSGGSSGYYQGALSVHSPFGSLSNMFSFSKTKSDGYRHNTNFDIVTAYGNSSFGFNSGNVNFTLGYTEKKFGANGFYSDKYPNQWEETKTFFTSSSVNFALGNLSVNPKAYWRNNKDYYLLDYQRPSFYKNTHETNSYGFELQSTLTTDAVTFSLGGEYNFDKIESSNLGNHTRNKGGISTEIYSAPIKNLRLIFGGFAYYYDSFGVKFRPGVDIGYKISNKISIYTSAGKSFRIPTFTELYYSSPAQLGNVNLQPEEAVTYESGINYYSSSFTSNIGVFLRKGNNLIDWIRETSDKPWRSENVAVINTMGFDLSFSFFPENFFDDSFIKKIKISYAYLDSDIEKNSYQSKYVLDHLRHQLISEITHYLPLNAFMSWVFRYEDRLDQESYFVTDAKLAIPLYKTELHIEVTNIFNHSYLDISGIPMPGRWIKAGLSLRFDNF